MKPRKVPGKGFHSKFSVSAHVGINRDQEQDKIAMDSCLPEGINFG